MCISTFNIEITITCFVADFYAGDGIEVMKRNGCDRIDVIEWM
jgi:hypothetical protein